jgi:hypothetical protein
MKLRVSVLAFAALLMMAAWAKAETPGAAPFCPASVAAVGLQSPGLVPDPALKAVTCGSCSYSSCVGKAANSICYYLGGGVYHQAKCVINSICSDNTSQCDCTNNPPQ